MDFNDVIKIAATKQHQIDIERRAKAAAKDKPAPQRLRNNRQKGVVSANVKAFLERKEREEKQKEEEAKRKKEALLQKRGEVKHAKTAKAMASRTKDNLQFYTKDKLNRFVAQEKEREQKQLEKDKRKYEKQMEKYERAQLKAQGISVPRKKKEKKDEVKRSEKKMQFPKPAVETKLPTKKPDPPKPRPKRPPPMDFVTLMKLANEKSQNPPSIEELKKELFQPAEKKRALTQVEKERQARIQTKEYQDYLKKGGKRPVFANGSAQTDTKEETSTSNHKKDRQPSKNYSHMAKGPNVKNSAGKSLPQVPNGKVGSMNSSGKSGVPVPNGRMSPLSSKKMPRPGPMSSKTQLRPDVLNDTRDPPNMQVNETVLQCGPVRDRPAAGAKRKSDDSSLNPFDRVMNRMNANKPPPAKKGRFVVESDSEYDSDMDDFIDDGDGAQDVSSLIRDIFGYDKRKYKDEDDDVSGMEANYSSIMKEEARSAKLGRKEDLEDIRREQEEEKRKAERRKLKEKELKKKKR